MNKIILLLLLLIIIIIFLIKYNKNYFSNKEINTPYNAPTATINDENKINNKINQEINSMKNELNNKKINNLTLSSTLIDDINNEHTKASSILSPVDNVYNELHIYDDEKDSYIKFSVENDGDLVIETQDNTSLSAVSMNSLTTPKYNFNNNDNRELTYNYTSQDNPNILYDTLNINIPDTNNKIKFIKDNDNLQTIETLNNLELKTDKIHIPHINKDDNIFNTNQVIINTLVVR